MISFISIITCIPVNISLVLFDITKIIQSQDTDNSNQNRIFPATTETLEFFGFRAEYYPKYEEI